MSRAVVAGLVAVFFVGCGRTNIPTNADLTPPKSLAAKPMGADSLKVTLPKGTLAPTAAFSVAYSDTVSTQVVVTLSVGEEVIETTSDFSGDKRLLTIAPKKAMPRGAEVRLQVRGAKSATGFAFTDVDQTLKTKLNPLVKVRTKLDAESLPVVTFTTLDDSGKRVSALTVEGDAETAADGVPESCTKYTHNADGSEEAQTTAGACDASSELTRYAYFKELDSHTFVGTSVGFGPDNKPRTSDDDTPAYAVITTAPSSILTCNSTTAGADKTFLTEDDEAVCSCQIDEAKAPEGFTRRRWTSADTCTVAEGMTYCNFANKAEMDGTSTRTITCLQAALPGVAAPEDLVTSTTVMKLDIFGQETENELTTSTAVTRLRTVYDVDGNRLESYRELSGADKLWGTPDDQRTVTDSYDPAQ